MINILYANVPVCGSPFTVDVFDPMSVQFVGEMPQCCIKGKAITFKGIVTCITWLTLGARRWHIRSSYEA